MANGRDDGGGTSRYLRAIFGGGIAIGRERTDAQLLDQFRGRAGDSAELGFAMLVERHGPMVMRTCRAILRDDHDIEDAFQAVFLVLVHKAGSLWVENSLGPWLHAVALRVAISARDSSLRRQLHEQRAGAMAGRTDSRIETPADDIGPAIHEEVGKLPDAYRKAVVLCDLEGLSHDEAARRLGWPVGTVKSRQARGRNRLRARLIRRGLAPTASGLASALAAESASAALPMRLVDSTVKVASLVASNQAATGLISTATLALTQGALRAMLLHRIKIAASALVLAGSVTGAAWSLQAVEEARPPVNEAAPKAVTLPQAAEASKPAVTKGDSKPRTFTVDVKDVETGLPVPHVHLQTHFMDRNRWGTIASATTDFSGKARITPPAGAEVHHVDISATRGGFVPLKIRWDSQEASPEVPERFLFRIERGVDIGGRVLDQDGKSIEDATVFIEPRKIETDSLQSFHHAAFELPTSTHAGGHWSFPDVPQHGVEIRLTAYHHLYLPRTQLYRSEALKPGSTLRDGSEVLKLERGIRIEGTVVGPNGKPVSGAAVMVHDDKRSIHNWRPAISTDKQGRFALGLKSGTVSNLTVQASGGFGPIQQRLRIGEQPQLLAITLPPGRTIRGRLVDRQGDPLRGRLDISSWRGLEILKTEIRTDADGRFVWDDAPDDEVNFRVFSENHSPKDISLVPGEHTIVLDWAKIPLGFRADGRL